MAGQDREQGGWGGLGLQQQEGKRVPGEDKEEMMTAN